MSDRLSRKEIKQQDAFQSFMDRSLLWVQENRKGILTGAIALVVLVVAAVALVFFWASRETAGQERLNRALEVYAAPIGQAVGEDGETFADEAARTARARELFQEVLDDYGSTDAGAVAHAYLGKMAAADGDVDAALEHWDDFLDGSDDHLLSGQIQLNRFSLLRAEGRGEEVREELEGMVGDEGAVLPQDVVLYELARTQEALGNQEGAEARFNQLVEEYPSSPYGQLARSRMGTTPIPEGLATLAQ